MPGGWKKLGGGASQAVALDLMLRTFMNSSEFNDIQNKNWDTIAKLIPSATTQEVRELITIYSGGGDILSHCPGPDVKDLYELF